jgi:CheY-like chemotaxis protein
MHKILIIDDEPDWREEHLKHPLIPLDCEVITEHDRANALDAILRQMFDVVVLNVQLNPNPLHSEIVPQWMGLLDLVVTRGSKVIVVASRGLPPPIAVDRLMRVAFKEYDVVDFVVKEDFDPKQYRDAVQKCVQIPPVAVITPSPCADEKPSSMSDAGPVMDPRVFIEDHETPLLFLSLKKFALHFPNGDQRQNILDNARVRHSGQLEFGAAPFDFAQALLKLLVDFSVRNTRPGYHPLVSFLEYVSRTGLDQYGLGAEDEVLCNLLIDRGKENFLGLKACSAVGRIESPKGTPIGTGVLLNKNLLLTCNHVLSRISRAWVRFNYEGDSYGSGNLFALDLELICAHNEPDHALAKIKGRPKQQPLTPSHKELSSGEDAQVRIVHYPGGRPLVVSGLGQIKQVGRDYIAHSLHTDKGSSGAPIFDRDWDFIAIHRGDPGVGRSLPEGTLEGVPIHALRDSITKHLL